MNHEHDETADDYTDEVNDLHLVRKRFINQLLRRYKTVLENYYEPLNGNSMALTQLDKVQADIDRLQKMTRDVGAVLRALEPAEYEDTDTDDGSEEDEPSEQDPRQNIIKSANNSE